MVAHGLAWLVTVWAAWLWLVAASHWWAWLEDLRETRLRERELEQITAKWRNRLHGR